MGNTDKHYYELKYIYNNSEITHKFPADIDIYRLEDYLKDFLKGCSWHEETLDKIFREDEL